VKKNIFGKSGPSKRGRRRRNYLVDIWVFYVYRGYKIIIVGKGEGQ